MTRAQLTILCLTALLLSAQIVQAEDVEWRVTRTKHFIIYYADGTEPAAERAGNIAEKWHATLSRKLKFEPAAITPIYLYPDRRSFAKAADVRPGERVVGLAHVRTRRIQVDASGAFADMAGVIPHELVHVFVSRKLKGHTTRLPLWMHEGLAKYLADDWTGQDAELLADAAAGGEIMRFERISTVFPEDERKRSIAYAQSYSAVLYLAETYGPECIPDLLSEMEAGRPFATALRYSIGVDPEKFEADWREYIWEEYRLDRWVKLGTGLISASMALFAILAFRARVLQKRRKARELAEAEKWDALTRGNPPD